MDEEKLREEIRKRIIIFLHRYPTGGRHKILKDEGSIYLLAEELMKGFDLARLKGKNEGWRYLSSMSKKYGYEETRFWKERHNLRKRVDAVNWLIDELVELLKKQEG